MENCDVTKGTGDRKASSCGGDLQSSVRFSEKAKMKHTRQSYFFSSVLFVVSLILYDFSQKALSSIFV